MPPLLTVAVDGSCHPNSELMHYHYANQIKEIPGQKIIAIDYDPDDYKLITKLVYNKYWIPILKETPSLLLTNWPARRYTSMEMFYNDIFNNGAQILVESKWSENLSAVNVDFVIKFKDIMFNDINQIVSDYLVVPRSSEIDNFILQYREINKKYL